jgi:hypothetical protein
MPSTKRYIDADKKTITLELPNGVTYGPIELTPTNDILTKIIGEMAGKIASLEAKTAHLV